LATHGTRIRVSLRHLTLLGTPVRYGILNGSHRENFNLVQLSSERRVPAVVEG
jgi:hypothetical protein